MRKGAGRAAGRREGREGGSTCMINVVRGFWLVVVRGGGGGGGDSGEGDVFKMRTGGRQGAVTGRLGRFELGCREWRCSSAGSVAVPSAGECCHHAGDLKTYAMVEESLGNGVSAHRSSKRTFFPRRTHGGEYLTASCRVMPAAPSLPLPRPLPHIWPGTRWTIRHCDACAPAVPKRTLRYSPQATDQHHRPTMVSRYINANPPAAAPAPRPTLRGDRVAAWGRGR